MLKSLALIFGLFFLAIGLLGFAPGASPNGLLFNVFHVNTLHNLVHIVSGVVALAAAWGGVEGLTPKLFFQVFGVFYLLLALLGFYFGVAPIFGILANNRADSFLHLALGAASLYFGFGCCKGVCKPKE